ncbi:MAG TPA: bifunctional DNA primase/polymerase [Chloroflexota bacterium]|nr:bifunctional DNA primase/polymerase [Chloroflexota bacterium]
MANKKALRLIELGLHPVLLGNGGEDLKRPLLKGWQTAVYTAADVRAWPPQNNIGIRCGLQRDGRALIIFDFDEEAERIFPTWQWGVAQRFRQPLVIVASGRGYHVYFFSDETYPGQTVAGRLVLINGRRRLVRFIETLGQGRQAVAAGGRHPGGQRYRFLTDTGYGDIPRLSAADYQRLLALSRTFDERLTRPQPRRTITPTSLSPHDRHGRYLDGIHNCLDYARRYIGAPEQVEPNGDIRFLGQGGLLLTADGRGWYSFSDDTGGGLTELITWHRAQIGQEEASRC